VSRREEEGGRGRKEGGGEEGGRMRVEGV